MPNIFYDGTSQHCTLYVACIEFPPFHTTINKYIVLGLQVTFEKYVRHPRNGTLYNISPSFLYGSFGTVKSEISICTKLFVHIGSGEIHRVLCCIINESQHGFFAILKRSCCKNDHNEQFLKSTSKLIAL